MEKEVAKLKETVLNTKALPRYFIDLFLREIEEGNTSPEWAKKMREQILFTENLLKK
ncbi:MAG: hypothetical protein PHV42_04495 [Candidatus Pacebacteria bacterium]|nr:hypothetical protein [Candidatus Paceibacterota bacterium]